MRGLQKSRDYNEKRFGVKQKFVITLVGLIKPLRGIKKRGRYEL